MLQPVQFADRDELKTSYVNKYKSYELLVMPFGFITTPDTFCKLMHKIFHPYLDKFVVIKFDDIVIYRYTLEEHVENLM